MDKRNKALLLGTMLTALLVVGSAMAIAPTEGSAMMAYTEDPLPVKTVKMSDLEMEITEGAQYSAEGESTTIEVDFENETIYVDGVQYELGEIHKIDAEEKGYAQISGCVESGPPNLHGPQYWPYCTWVNVAIVHHPSNVDVLLGVANSAGVGVGITDRDHNGVASFRYHIPEDGDYYVVVGAPDGSFCYDGYVSW